MGKFIHTVQKLEINIYNKKIDLVDLAKRAKNLELRKKMRITVIIKIIHFKFKDLPIPIKKRTSELKKLQPLIYIEINVNSTIDIKIM